MVDISLLEERFLAKTVRNLSGCLIWTGASVGHEPWIYGTVWDGSRVVKAHRWAYEHWIGPIQEGQVVRHRCDVTLCVDPAHLIPGMHIDNMRDMVERGRSPRNDGERNPRAKLTAEEVVIIRQRAEAGESQSAIARSIGVTSQMIGRIVRRQNWT